MTIATNADKLRDELAPLFCQYPDQEPQPAYITIDPVAGTAEADWDGLIGAVPMEVWRGKIRRLSVPSRTKGKVIAAILEDPELLAFITRICGGYSAEWDGNQYIGRLTDDAVKATEEAEAWLDSHIDEDDLIAVWDVDEWLPTCPEEITAESTDEELDALAEELEREALADNTILLGDVGEYLRELRGGRTQ